MAKIKLFRFKKNDNFVLGKKAFNTRYYKELFPAVRLYLLRRTPAQKDAAPIRARALSFKTRFRLNDLTNQQLNNISIKQINSKT